MDYEPKSAPGAASGRDVRAPAPQVQDLAYLASWISAKTRNGPVRLSRSEREGLLHSLMDAFDLVELSPIVARQFAALLSRLSLEVMLNGEEG